MPVEPGPWKLERSGTDPAYSSGPNWVFFTHALDPMDRRLPGIAFGDAKGPRYGLLDGDFAPLISLPEKTYELRIDAHANTLTAHFSDALTVTIEASPLRIVMRGEATLLIPADRTAVRATLHGAPTTALTVTAGDPAESLTLHADALTLGKLALTTSCPFPRLTRPGRRDATSVFLLQLARRTESCPAVTTSTLTP